MLTLRFVHLGSCPAPCQVVSVGAIYPVRSLFPGSPALSMAQGDTRNNSSGGGQLPSPGVSSRSNYCNSQSAGDWMLWGGAPDLLSLGPPATGVLAVLPGPSRLRLSRVEAGSWAVSPAPWAPRPALLESGSRPCSPLSVDLHPSPSKLLPGHGACCSPLESSATGCGALPGAGAFSYPREPEGIPALLGSCSESLWAPVHPGSLVQLLLLRQGSPDLGVLAAASAQLLRAPPLGCF